MQAVTMPSRSATPCPHDAWRVELSEAVLAPAAWVEIPSAEKHLPGAAFPVAVLPDEDPNLEPTGPSA